MKVERSRQGVVGDRSGVTSPPLRQDAALLSGLLAVCHLPPRDGAVLDSHSNPAAFEIIARSTGHSNRLVHSFTHTRIHIDIHVYIETHTHTHR